MNYRKKAFAIGFILSVSTLAGGCQDLTKTAEKLVNDAEEAVQVSETEGNEQVLAVKGGTLDSYPDKTIEEAFSNFFSSPEWKYFVADTGEDVVEFTGYCMYSDKEVKAKMQFLPKEGSDIFEVGALEFNEVPQDEITKNALIMAVFETEDTETADTQTVEKGEETAEDTKVAENSEKPSPQNNNNTMSKRDKYISKLDGIEAGLSDLDYLYANGITAEMAEATSETHKRWDDVLNEIWGVLKTQLPKDEMDELTRLQRNWLDYRDNTAESNASFHEGGSMEGIEYTATLAELTKERCYELVYGYMR